VCPRNAFSLTENYNIINLFIDKEITFMISIARPVSPLQVTSESVVEFSLIFDKSIIPRLFDFDRKVSLGE
jgi:hypothetical protein